MSSFNARKSQKHKKCSQVVSLFALLGSAHVKAVRKMLVKLTRGVNFINILLKAFMFVGPKSAEKTDKLTVFFALL